MKCIQNHLNTTAHWYELGWWAGTTPTEGRYIFGVAQSYRGDGSKFFHHSAMMKDKSFINKSDERQIYHQQI